MAMTKANKRRLRAQLEDFRKRRKLLKEAELKHVEDDVEEDGVEEDELEGDIEPLPQVDPFFSSKDTTSSTTHLRCQCDPNMRSRMSRHRDRVKQQELKDAAARFASPIEKFFRP